LSFRRALLLFLFLLPLALVPSGGCATSRAARTFAPATDAEMREALAAITAAQERAAAQPAARLLYDAHMRPGKGPAVPGTLAVTYDGHDVARASLTGPFGSRVAEYSAGTVTGEDRKALVVDPAALRAVLAGSWAGDPDTVQGCDGDDCLVVWTGRVRAAAVVSRREQRLRTLTLEGDSGTLDVEYAGAADPWPTQIAANEERSGRGLKLSLVAREPQGNPPPETDPTPR
jgi:hypothetical protein